MQPPFPCPTATWHNNTYAEIDPSSPENSQSGKTVLIVGAGSGVGREAAVAFATAGAKHLILIGRTESTLTETQKLLSASNSTKTTTSSVFAGSVADEKFVKHLAESVTGWDVLIMGAGYLATPGSIASTDLADFWTTYEINVKSIVILAQALFSKANPTGAAFYGLTSGSMVLPPAAIAGSWAYQTSKLAQVKLLEFLAVEYPNIFFANVHPGLVDTTIFRKSGATPEHLPTDNVQLPAHFLVWLSQPKTKFLNGRMVWANWDVTELLAKADAIKSSAIFTSAIEGWPFSSS